MKDDKLYILGYASGVAGIDITCGEGPLAIKKSPFLSKLQNDGDHFVWAKIIEPAQYVNLHAFDYVYAACHDLASYVSELLRAQKRLIVLGGDHSAALGTWSGVYDAYHNQGDIGLIWIDAHMDSHTPDTTETGRIHGMPLASLLGHGPSALTEILHKEPKLKPENVCLVGIRSFESGEQTLLNELGVRIFYMDEINKRGLQSVLNEAVKVVTKQTIGFGISLDLDGLDPADAPGVDLPEPNGIKGLEVLENLRSIVKDPRFLAMEIVEFDPTRDVQHITEQLVVALLAVFIQGKTENAGDAFNENCATNLIGSPRQKGN